MQKVVLHIENSNESKTIELGDELTIGRTDPSDLVLDDSGLSRKNTTIFCDGELVLVADENSTNGTFLNGRRISGPPQELQDGDKLTLGSHTSVRIRIGESASRQEENPVVERLASAAPQAQIHPAAVKTAAKAPGQGGPPWILIAAGLMTFVIVLGAATAFFLVSGGGSDSNSKMGKPTPVVLRSSLIPVRVIDPLGGEDEDDLDDIIASWETQEEEIKADNLEDVKVAEADTEEKDLAVTRAFFEDRQRKAYEPRNAETGIRPAGLNVPKELFGDGVIKQKAKLREMNTTGYHQPMDFAELAEKRLKKELIEMPMATQSFYLSVGSSAGDGPFQSYSFENDKQPIAPGSPKYNILLQLASNFTGQKFDLNNPADRKQMRIRLLRMFNPRARPILKELADAYFAKYNRPLRVTSLTRSIDYQMDLNRTNANSFKVRGAGSLPPHTSGCAFDLARQHMTADEQNFVMQKLAEMERANKLDALIEYGTNACFHIFIYFDGIPPRM